MNQGSSRYQQQHHYNPFLLAYFNLMFIKPAIGISSKDADVLQEDVLIMFLEFAIEN